MIKGKVSVKAVTFEDLVKLNIIDKKEISLGEIELNIGKPKNRTLDDVAKQKRRQEDISNKLNNINLQDNNAVIHAEEKEEEEKQEEREEQEPNTRDDGANDMII